jgi:hypothetical protein
VRPLPRELLVLSVTPLSRGPAVAMVDVEELAKLGITAQDEVLRWCEDFGALYIEDDPGRFALDVTAAYVLGRGFHRCVFRR